MTDENGDRIPGNKSAWSQLSNVERIIWVVKAPLRTILCFFNVTAFILAYFGFMLPILFTKVIWPRFYWFCEGKLYRWLEAFVAYWGYTAGYDVVEYGDDLSGYSNERVLVISNHQSTADVPTLMVVLQSKGVASRKTLWLMDVLFRWTPFGVIAQMHGDYFIRQGKATREKELLRLKEHLRNVFWDRDRLWVILFPEGGFYYKRIKDSQKYGSEHGYPHLEYTTLPRFGAMKAILEEVGPRKEDENSSLAKSHSRSKLKLLKDTVDDIREKKYVKIAKPPIKYVVDVTIAYPYGMPLSLLTLCLGTREKCNVSVHYRVYDAKQVPFHDDEALRDWMYKRYQEKDIMLKNFYENGWFVQGEKGSVVYFSWWKIVGQHLFWCASVYVQYCIYKWLLLQSFTFVGLI